VKYLEHDVAPANGGVILAIGNQSASAFGWGIYK